MSKSRILVSKLGYNKDVYSVKSYLYYLYYLNYMTQVNAFRIYLFGRQVDCCFVTGLYMSLLKINMEFLNYSERIQGKLQAVPLHM